jgi:histidyl-tRNA synthetase
MRSAAAGSTAVAGVERATIRALDSLATRKSACLLEPTELFSRGLGEATDAVEEMYNLLDRDGEQLSLRPEGTAAVSGRVCNTADLRQTQRLVSRPDVPLRAAAKRPYRQFEQIGAEAFGMAGRTSTPN